MTTYFDSAIVGGRIRLVHTNDPYTKLRSGDTGTVVAVHDSPFGDRVANVMWDCGSTLSLIAGEDSFQVLDRAEAFVEALGAFVRSAFALSNAWEGLDSDFSDFLNTHIEWGFPMSLDEYAYQLDAIHARIKQELVDKQAHASSTTD